MEKLVCISGSETYFFHISLWVCVCVLKREMQLTIIERRKSRAGCCYGYSRCWRHRCCVCAWNEKEKLGILSWDFSDFLYSVGYCLCVNDDNDDNDNYDDYFLVLISSICPSPLSPAPYLFLFFNFSPLLLVKFSFAIIFGLIIIVN